MMPQAVAEFDGRRIVVASILPPRGQTGVQTHINALLGSDAARSAGVELVTPFDLSPALVIPAFAPGRLARPFSQAAWVWWYRESHRRVLVRALRRKLDSIGPAIIYAQDPVSAASALDLRRRGYAADIILAVHYNGSQADEWATMGKIRSGGALYRSIKHFERKILPEMDGMVFVSEYARRQAWRDVPEAATVPARCVPNFAEDRGPPDFAGEFEADLLCIGSLEPRKNQAFALRVLAAINARGLNYRLTVVGSGPSERDLQSLVRELDIEKNVDFRGYVPGAGALFPTHRACLHAAKTENMPITLLEALASGRPIFAPAVGGMPEIFDDGVEGRFIDLDDPERGAGAVIEVLEDSRRYLGMCRSARARYERDFTVESVVPRLIDAIRGVASAGKVR